MKNKIAQRHIVHFAQAVVQNEPSWTQNINLEPPSLSSIWSGDQEFSVKLIVVNEVYPIRPHSVPNSFGTKFSKYLIQDNI